MAAKFMFNVFDTGLDLPARLIVRALGQSGVRHGSDHAKQAVLPAGRYGDLPNVYQR